jgi:hypothetical protein
MERKRLLTLLIAFCFLGLTQSQTLYSYNNIYSIKLPASLELQSSELNSIRRINIQGKSSQVKISTPSNRIVFQQKGVNADTKSAYSKYCRVIVEYYKESKSEPVYGRNDQIVVDRNLLYAVHGSVQEACNINKTPLLKFLNIQPLIINGFPVLFYSYRRKGWEGKQPPVIVNVFRIFNRYESVTLTFSYREAERESWKSIHNNITKSFQFTNKY